MKRRKVTYPVARTHTKGAPRAGAGPEVAVVRPNLVAIDITAGAGRANLKVGGRVRINGTGLYAGEEATIERLVERRHPDSRGPNRRRAAPDASGRSTSTRSPGHAEPPPTRRQWPTWRNARPRPHRTRTRLD